MQVELPEVTTVRPLFPKRMAVRIRESEILAFMRTLGVNSEDVYEVIGATADQLMILVGDRVVEVYPRKVIVDSIDW